MNLRLVKVYDTNLRTVELEQLQCHKSILAQSKHWNISLILYKSCYYILEGEYNFIKICIRSFSRKFSDREI